MPIATRVYETQDGKIFKTNAEAVQHEVGFKLAELGYDQEAIQLLTEKAKETSDILRPCIPPPTRKKTKPPTQDAVSTAQAVAA